MLPAKCARAIKLALKRYSLKRSELCCQICGSDAAETIRTSLTITSYRRDTRRPTMVAAEVYIALPTGCPSTPPKSILSIKTLREQVPYGPANNISRPKPRLLLGDSHQNLRSYS